MIGRRGFITGLVAVVAAPAVARPFKFGSHQPLIMTGHRGLVASKLAPELLKDFSIMGIDKKDGALFDLADRGQWCDMIEEGDTVLHLAADLSEDQAKLDRDNYAAVRWLFLHCLRVGVEHVVFASSVRAAPRMYGDPKGPADDLPNSKYGWSKVFVEGFAANLAQGQATTRFTGVRLGWAPPAGTDINASGEWARSVYTPDEVVVRGFKAALADERRFAIVECFGETVR